MRELGAILLALMAMHFWEEKFLFCVALLRAKTPKRSGPPCDLLIQ